MSRCGLLNLVCSVLVVSSAAAFDGAENVPLRPYFKDEKWGYANQVGKLQIEPRFDLAGPFGGGLAPVRIDEKYGYIDTQGEIVITPRFQWAGTFKHGRAVAKANDKFGYIDREGEFVIEPQFRIAKPFREGIAIVAKEAGQFGAIDDRGESIIDLKYASIDSFSEGLAIAKEDGGMQILTSTGKPVLKLAYPDVGKFQNGFAPVRSGEKWGAIDTKGKLVVNPRFDSLYIAGPGILMAREGETPIFGRLEDSGAFNFLNDGPPPNESNVLWEAFRDRLALVHLKSIPNGAVVYKPSLWEYRHADNIEQFMCGDYLVPGGATNVKDLLEIGQVYYLIFVHNGNHKGVQVVPESTPQVVLRFDEP